jgi:mRNA interferase RelE/StbE
VSEPASWTVEFDRDAAKDLRKLGRPAQQAILRYLRERIATAEDPRRFGKPLAGDLAGLWRYRVGDYRLVVTFEDKRLVVLVVTAGHRRSVYE